MTRGRRRLWTRAEIIRQLQLWPKMNNGRTPRMLDWQDAAPGRPSSRTVAMFFGSWNNALIEAGLPIMLPQGGRVKE